VRAEIVPSTSGRYCWRLWEDGQIIARGAGSSEERAQLAAAIAEERWNRREDLHLYGGQPAPEAPVVPSWLQSGGGENE